jgi:anti-anti-sigma factor
MTQPDGLDLNLTYRGGVMALRLTGDLDLVSTARFTKAMAWIRRRTERAIILDTSGLSFIDLTGYRALNAALALPDGRRDPRVLYVVGASVAKLGALLDRATRFTPPGRRRRAAAPPPRRVTTPRPS